MSHKFFMCGYNEIFFYIYIYKKEVHFSFAVLLGMFAEAFLQ